MRYSVTILFTVISVIAALFFVGNSIGMERNVTPAAQHMGSIKVELGKALELRTRSKVISVAIGLKEIADVMPVTPMRIRILGLKPGATNLIIYFAEHHAEEYELLVNQGYRVEVIYGIVTNPDASLVGW